MWRRRRVGDLAHLISGYPFDAKAFAPHGEVPLVRIRDLSSDRFETFLPDEAVPRTALISDGDVVIGMDGDFNATHWSRGPAALNQRLCVLRYNGQSDTRFLAYALTPHLKVINDLTYSTTVKHLSSGQVRAIRLPAPDITEQRAIADFLDRETARIDTLIEEQQRLIHLLQERRHALRTHLVLNEHGREVGHMATGLPWAPDVPTDWEVVPLTSVTRLESGHTPSRSREDWWENCYIPWVSLNDVGEMRHRKYLDSTRNLISDEGLANSSARLLPPETVLLSRDATVGRTAIMEIAMATSQHFAAWVCGSRLLPEYLWALFTDAMQPFFESFQNGSTIRTIGMGDLKAFRIPLPPVDEQRRIVESMDEQTANIDALMSESERFIELSHERRAALITAAVTGQIDVRAAV